jgi:hypothetical protein
MAMSQKSGGRGFLGLVSWRFTFVLLVSILIGQIADRHVRHGDGYSPSFFWVSQQGLLILAVLVLLIMAGFSIQWFHRDKLSIESLSKKGGQQIRPKPKGPALCPQCSNLLKPGKQFCSNCGYQLGASTAPIERCCPKCNRIVPPGKRFCTADGTPVP